jgi:hypothetical protein
MRCEFWLQHPADTARLTRIVRALFKLPADEEVYVGRLEDAPPDPRRPRVRVLTRQADGDYPWVAEIVIEPALAEHFEWLEPFIIGENLARLVDQSVLFADETSDRAAWVLAAPDGTLTPVRVDTGKLRHGQLHIAELLPVLPLAVTPGEPVKAPRRVVPLATLLAARDYLRDQIVTAAKMAYPDEEPSILDVGNPGISGFHPFGRHRYNCTLRIATGEGRPDWNAERAVRNLTRAFAQLGWKVDEPRKELMGSAQQLQWYGGAERDGYVVSIITHQSTGIVHLGGATADFRLRRWEVPGA